MLRKNPDVFGDNIGCLECTLHLETDPLIRPVQHALRRVPQAIRSQLQEELATFVKDGIISRVDSPSTWVSNLVVVRKPTGKVRTCLDPKDLNRSLLRYHYPVPTIEEIVEQLHGARVFSVCDVKSGFWHVPLAEHSSWLTTFATPFGR